MKIWMILNVSSLQFDLDGEILIEARRPSFVHYSQESAERELLRLQAANPFEVFVLLESVAETKMRSLVPPIFSVQEIENEA